MYRVLNKLTENILLHIKKITFDAFLFVVKILESLQYILKPFVNDTRDIESKMKQLGNNFHRKIKNYLMIFSNMQHFFSFYRSYYFAELSFQFEED